MRPARLSAARLADHLTLESPEVRRVVRALRRMVLSEAPGAAEGVRFHCLCYFDAKAPFGAIGGNVCMIEFRNGEVALSFLHGAALRDPHELLRGSGKSKRFIPAPDAAVAKDARVRALVRQAAALAERRAAEGWRAEAIRIRCPNGGGTGRA